MANRVVHFDIYADDVERAIAFYLKVFGWTIQKVDGMDYGLFRPVRVGPALMVAWASARVPPTEIFPSLATPAPWMSRM